MDDSSPSLVRPRLYLGSEVHQADANVLATCGITHILQVAASTEPSFPAAFTYKTLSLLDTECQDIISQLPPCFDFIDQALAEGGTVLVHCHEGVSRAPAVLAAYLMSTEGLPHITALDHVKAARPIVNPNHGFCLQLQQFEVIGSDPSNWQGWDLYRYLHTKFTNPPCPTPHTPRPPAVGTTSPFPPPATLSLQPGAPTSTSPPPGPRPTPPPLPPIPAIAQTMPPTPSPAPLHTATTGSTAAPPPAPPMPILLPKAAQPHPPSTPMAAVMFASVSTQADMVRPRLYLSGQGVERNLESLQHYGITHILQVAGEATPSFPGEFSYLTLPMEDVPNYDIIPPMEACLAFIDDALRSGGTILVHCQLGMSRSASVVIGYIMWKDGASFQASYGEVRGARKLVSPNPGFKQQLQRFEGLGCDFSRWPGWDNCRHMVL